MNMPYIQLTQEISKSKIKNIEIVNIFGDATKRNL